ncbi:MAG: InlB B-repeat-containing protein [Solirubrobacteraceae bacterium]
MTSQPAGIDCPGTCTATFAQGATLTAQPAPGYAFGDPNDNGAPGNKDGWLTFVGDNCTIAPGQPQVCTVPGDEDTEITAHFRPAAQLDVVPSGRGSVTATIPNPGAGEQASQTCNGDAQGGVSCEYTYLPGREVTLVASPDTNEGPSSFVRWSDERCPAGPVCTLTMDAARQSIVALFTPQRVSVRVRGTGRVTSTPAGLDCQGDGDPDVDTECFADFPIGTDVSLAAADTSPLSAQSPAWYLPCDFGAGSACGITADRARWAAIGFDGQVPAIAQVPPTITVRFHILKAGSGSGRVQGNSIDCGGSCSVLRDFGARQTLTATPDAGSRFAGWRSACSSAATCTLAVGPVTAVTAAFETSGSSSSSSSGSSSSSSGHGASTAFTARLARPVVKGHGGKRVVVFRVRVSTPATVRAQLTRRQRMVASRNWRVSAGLHQLRLRLPRTAKAGAYRLRLTVRDASGHAKSFAPSLHIPR